MRALVVTVTVVVVGMTGALSASASEAPIELDPALEQMFGDEPYCTNNPTDLKQCVLPLIARLQEQCKAQGTCPDNPRWTAKPVISGAAQEGQLLTATRGSWTGQPVAYAARWYRCSGPLAPRPDPSRAKKRSSVVGLNRDLISRLAERASVIEAARHLVLAVSKS